MAKNEWTKEERQEMVRLMAEIEAQHRCEHCLIVPTDSTYCEGCANDIVLWLADKHGRRADQLAAEYAEQIAIERGLY